MHLRQAGTLSCQVVLKACFDRGMRKLCYILMIALWAAGESRAQEQVRIDANGATASFTVVVNVTAVSGSITNTVAGSSDASDPVSTNNSATAITAILAPLMPRVTALARTPRSSARHASGSFCRMVRGRVGSAMPANMANARQHA